MSPHMAVQAEANETEGTNATKTSASAINHDLQAVSTEEGRLGIGV